MGPSYGFVPCSGNQLAAALCGSVASTVGGVIQVLQRAGHKIATASCCRPDFEMKAVTVAAGNLAGPDGTSGPIVQVSSLSNSQAQSHTPFDHIMVVQCAHGPAVIAGCSTLAVLSTTANKPKSHVMPHLQP